VMEVITPSLCCNFISYMRVFKFKIEGTSVHAIRFLLMSSVQISVLYF